MGYGCMNLNGGMTIPLYGKTLERKPFAKRREWHNGGIIGISPGIDCNPSNGKGDIDRCPKPSPLVSHRRGLWNEQFRPNSMHNSKSTTWGYLGIADFCTSPVQDTPRSETWALVGTSPRSGLHGHFSTREPVAGGQRWHVERGWARVWNGILGHVPSGAKWGFD